MLSPPSLAIRYVILKSDSHFCLEGTHFHRCGGHYLAVQQPSYKRGRKITVLFRDIINFTGVRYEVTYPPTIAILWEMSVHPAGTSYCLAFHCQIFLT